MIFRSKKIRQAFALCCCLLWTFLNSCASRKSTVVSQDLVSEDRSSTDGDLKQLTVPKPFCDSYASKQVNENMRYAHGRFWTHAELQKYIREAAFSLEGNKKIDGSYLVIYEEITGLRDDSRCSPDGVLHSKDPLVQRLMDGLADTMTRGLVEMTLACSRGEVLDIDLDGFWCANQERMRKWDSIRVALGTMVAYLTVNMGNGIAALPYADHLWLHTSYQSLDARLKFLKENFKTHYNANNAFIASHAGKAAERLVAAGYASACPLTQEACVNAFRPIFQLLLRITRDNTFDAAMKIAEQRKGNDNPRLSQIQWLASSGGNKFYELAGKFGKLAKPIAVNKAEKDLQTYALGLMEPMSKISLRFVGGKKQDDP